MAEGMFFTWEDLKKHDREVEARALRRAADTARENAASGMAASVSIWLDVLASEVGVRRDDA